MAIGLAVIIVSVSVVLGFKHTIRNKVIGFGSHITVADFMSLQNSELYPITINDSLLKALYKIQGVKHVQRFAYTQGILKTDDDFLGVTLKGVGPEFDSTFIHNNMVAGSFPKFSDNSNQQKIILSKTIADKLKMKVGQKIFAYFVNEQGVRTRKFTVCGIYETNLKQFDSQICMTDLYTVNKLNGWEPDQYSGAELEVKDFNLLDNTALNVLGHVKNKVDKYGSTYSSATVIEQKPTDILMARPNGFECLDYFGFDDISSWCNYDIWTSYHYIGTHTNDWPHEGDRSKKSADKTCFPVVCHFHYRKRINNRKYSRYRSHIAATIYRAI